MIRPFLLVALLLFVAASPLRAQDATAQQDSAQAHIRIGLALAASGDTAAALLELNRAVEVAPKLAEAHYQLGRVLARRGTEDEEGSRYRRQAQSELLQAIDLDPSNPAYLMELSQLREGRNASAAGDSLIDQALEKLEIGSPTDREQLAYLYFNLGFIEERNYERFRDRAVVTLRGQRPSTSLTPVGPTPWINRYVDYLLESSAPIPGSGSAIRDQMAEYYTKALYYDPTHMAASQRLLLYYVEGNLLQEYLALAQRLVEAHPDRPEAYLYLGLGLHAVAREEEAGTAYDQALAIMSPADRSPFLNLAPVMRREPAEQYAQLDTAATRRYEERFWRLTDPLYLTDANERRLEHLSRVAYTDLRFSEPATGRRGWETERGIIFIRYGPPDVIARYSGPIVWSYSNGGFVFMFSQTPGYFYTRFAGDYQWVANEARHVRPATYINIPSLPVLLDIPMQIARFRGDSPADLAVEIHSELPLEALSAGLDLQQSEIETGLFLLNIEGVRIVQDIKTEVLSYEDAQSRNALRSWRLHLPAAGSLVAAVEARDQNTWRAAVARDSFTAEFFTDDSLSISDILLADNIRLLASKPQRRSDFDIAANPARRYVPNQPVNIYYELYGLERDSEGFGSYEVSLAVTVKSLSREGTALDRDRGALAILGLLADAWGFSIVGDDRLELRFSRELDMKGRDRATEYHSLDLQDAPPGEYEIALRVYDRQRLQLASRTRTFIVIRDE